MEVVETPDGAVPANPTWAEFPEIVEKTAQLTTEKGTAQEATEEGGAVVDVRYNKNKYKFECELFVKKGDSKPIEDTDGVVAENYCLRLTPEDDTLEGFILENTSVSVEETWSSENGKRWKYTFQGLKPKTGNILKPYTKA